MKVEMVVGGDGVRTVEVEEGDGCYRVSIEDSRGGATTGFEVDFDDATGAAHLRIGSRSYLVEVSESKGTYTACTREHRLEARLYTGEQRLREQLDARSGPGGKPIQARMPGKVLEVFVEAGVEVAEGDKIAILEAMKMENVIRAPKRGTIAAVGVAAGETVQAGQTIVEFEESA